jgi:hypothetical protein
MERKTTDKYRAFLVLAVVFMVLFGLGGTLYFVKIWQHGDQKAQAFAGLLAFIASIFSSLATIFYVYLTNASLRKAQESIDLQRQEWEQKVRVSPQFWITIEGENKWYLGKNDRALPLKFRGGFCLHIWNYSEQSFLVDGVLLERTDIPTESRSKDYQQLVIVPHSVGKIDVSSSVMHLITHTPEDYKPDSVLRGPDEHARIEVALTFTDWSQFQAQTHRLQFVLDYCENDTVTIRRGM